MQAAFIPLIIIGGGPIGMACAIEAHKNNIPCLIIEKGCLVNSIYNYPANMTFFSTSERLEIGNIPFVSNQPKPHRSEALEYYRRVAATFNLPVHLFEKVLSVKKRRTAATPGRFLITTSKNKYYCNHVIIATGFYDIPKMLNVPGEDLSKVTHYYNEPHFYARQKVLVVGAQNSAVDAALETWRKGAEVTMVIKDNEIGKRVKYWVRPDIINRIEEGSIKAYFNSTVHSITPYKVKINTPEGITEIDNDWVIALTGYSPDLNFLTGCSIRLSDDEVKKPHYNELTHETNVAGIYLAGVICGGNNTHRLFIENSREHAVKIIKAVKKATKALPGK